MGVDQAIDITPEQRAIIIALLNKHLPRTTAWVYGSRANWTSRPESDLDLVVFLAPKQAHAVSNLREAFEESDLPFKVDLFVWDEVPKAFHEAIKRDHVVLTEVKHRVCDQIETTYGIFCADFQESRLKDICTEGDGIQTGPFGSQLHKRDYVETGTPIITVEHLGCNRIIHDKDIPRVSEQDRRRLYKYSLRVGDIVFSRVGSVDRRALVRDGEEGWLFSGRCLRVRPDISKIHPTFLSYFFGLPSFREHIRSIAVGATMPSLNTRILGEAEIVHPTKLSEQRSIAQILEALDDKIELNRRMNKTLEAMARSIFKDWFVDFGPTRAKAEGRTPYLVSELWGLFPSALDEEAKPLGWQDSVLGDRVEIHDSKRIPLSSRERKQRRGPYPYHGATGVMDHVDDFLFEGIHVLLGEDGSVVKPDGRPFTQYVWGQFWVNNHAHVLTGRGISNEMLLCFLDQMDVAPYVTGAVQPKLNQKNLKAIPFPPTDPNTIVAFDTVVAPLFEQTRINTEMIRTLSKMRDVLLPKLISGEIRLA